MVIDFYVYFYKISHLLGKPHGPDFDSSPVVCCAAGAPALSFTCSGLFVPTVVAFAPLAPSFVVAVVLLIVVAVVPFVAPFVVAAPPPVVDVAAAAAATGSCFAALASAPPSSHAKLTLETAW